MSATEVKVMMKVLMVDEGLKEMIVESKYRARGGEKNGKVSWQTGRSSAPLKNLPMIDDAHLELRSEEHMVLIYEPWMKRVHPRASKENWVEFDVSGSRLMYHPAPSEYVPDMTANATSEMRHEMFFKREEMSEEQLDASFDWHSCLTYPTSLHLWWASSVLSAKGNPVMKCEQVGSSIIEEIPLSALAPASHRHPLSFAADPYLPDSHYYPLSSHASGHQATKKHGKHDALEHPSVHTSRH